MGELVVDSLQLTSGWQSGDEPIYIQAQLGIKQINRESPFSDCYDSTERLEMLSREACGDWEGDMSSVDSTDISLQWIP